MVVYDLEIFNADKAVPYANCIYTLSKLSGKNNRDESEKEDQKCLNDCIVFKGLDNINQTLDYVLQFKGELKELIIKLLNIIYTYLLIKDQDLVFMLF